MEDEVIQSVASVFEAIIALLNLIVIIYFTISERREKSAREKEYDEQRKLEKDLEIQQKRKEIVYSKVVAGRLYEILEKYFDDLIQMIENIGPIKIAEKGTIAENLCEEFRASKRIFKSTILSILTSLNKKEAERVKNILEQFEDDMIDSFQRNILNKSRVLQNIDKTRIELIKVLLQMDLTI